MRPARVLYLIDKLTRGGAQRHLVGLAGGLDRSRFEPAVCCLQFEGELAGELRGQGVEVFSLGIRRIYDAKGVASMVRLAHRMRKREVKILHSYLFSAHLAAGLAAAVWRPEVVISSRRDLFSHAGGKRLAATRLANRFVDRIVANSQAVAEMVRRVERFPSGRISVIYNGVDLERFEPGRGGEDFRREYHIPDDAPLVGTVANLTAVKGVDVFVRAAGVIAREAPEARFVIAGSGPLEGRLNELAEELGLSEKLLLIGSLEDVRPLLSAVDVFMLLSRSEGMSNALLEAMATARPIVATKVGGNVEAISDGESGVLVRPDDPEAAAEAAMMLLREAGLGERLRAAARREAEARFSLDAMVRAVEELYGEALEKKADVSGRNA